MLLTPLALCPQLKVTDSAAKRTERTAAHDAHLAALKRETAQMQQDGVDHLTHHGSKRE